MSNVMTHKIEADRLNSIINNVVIYKKKLCLAAGIVKITKVSRSIRHEKFHI